MMISSGGRRTGKTIELIKQASISGKAILVTNDRMAERIKRISKEIDCPVNVVVSVLGDANGNR